MHISIFFFKGDSEAPPPCAFLYIFEPVFIRVKGRPLMSPFIQIIKFKHFGHYDPRNKTKISLRSHVLIY